MFIITVRSDRRLTRSTRPGHCIRARQAPRLAAENIGRCAYGLFKQGPSRAGQTVGVAGEHLSGMEMAAALTNALGEEVRYADISPAQYRRLPMPAAAELGNMFQFKRDSEDVFRSARCVDVSRQLNPRLQTFADWLADYKDQISIESAA